MGKSYLKRVEDIKGSLNLLMLLASIQLWGQNTLTEQANAMRDSDDVPFQIIEFSSPGASGENKVWDFSSVQISGESYDIFYTKDTLSGFHKTEKQESYSYVMNESVLEQYRFESRLTKIKYFERKRFMKYPFQYGDSVTSSFEGYGTYCGNHFVKVKGQVMVQADGFGRLVVSEKDTLDNVLRVYTITVTSMAMDVDVTDIDSTNLKQEIEEKYEWYAKGFRYPVYTTVQKTSFTNMEAVGSTQLAYRLLPEDFSQINDAVNDSIKLLDDRRKKLMKPRQDIFHYSVKRGESGVDISYTADADADVVILVSSSGGILYRKQCMAVKGGEASEIHISTDGLPKSQYVLYFNVNGKVYSKSINVK